MYDAAGEARSEVGLAHYKSFMIARQDATSKRSETVFDTYKGVIERNGGRLDTIEMWGVKSLAYRIKKNRKAQFALLDIDASPAAIAEMERQMQTSEDVLRVMTVRIEEPAPDSAVRERDHRRDNDSALNALQTELNAYSNTILEELRNLNDHIEERFQRNT